MVNYAFNGSSKTLTQHTHILLFLSLCLTGNVVRAQRDKEQFNFYDSQARCTKVQHLQHQIAFVSDLHEVEAFCVLLNEPVSRLPVRGADRQHVWL